MYFFIYIILSRSDLLKAIIVQKTGHSTICQLVNKRSTTEEIGAKCEVNTWACGAMDNASDYGSEDSRFDSWQARILLYVVEETVLGKSDETSREPWRSFPYVLVYTRPCLLESRL